MYVIESEILEKQISNNSKRKDIVSRLNKIIDKLFYYETIEEIVADKDLGFKTFKGKNYDVGGIDIGKTNSSSLSGERLIVSFLKNRDKNNEFIYKTTDETINDKKIKILLHFYCKHDDQNKKSDLVNESYIRNHDYIPLEKILSSNDIQDVDNSVNLKSKYNNIVYSDYMKPKVTVLSMDKFDYISKFLFDTKPTILTGIAGSGKTEVIIRIMHDIAKIDNSKKILYVTFSEHLTLYVEEKCSTFNHINVDFYSLKSLIRKLSRTNINEKEFGTIQTFNEFIKEYKNSKLDVDYNLKNKLLVFTNNNSNYRIYSDIYGIITGSMLDQWDRKTIQMISFEEYKSTTKDYKLFEESELHNVYELAKLYIKYLEENNLLSYNIESIKLLNSDTKEIYDYVLVDEIQDLTECQIMMLKKLVKNDNNILLCGDTKQVINPTFYKRGRIEKLFNISNKSIYILNSNYRNSKSITKLINKINSIREEKLTALHQEDQMLEDSKNTSHGNVYNYNGNIDDLLSYFEGAGFDVIVDEKEFELLEQKGKDTYNFYTVQQSKGREFENVCVLNLLSNKEDIFKEIWYNTKSKDASLHYNFNLYYVAITRTKNNLILVEQKQVDMFNHILETVNCIEEVSDPSEIDIYSDKSAFAYYNEGRKLVDENGLYEKAKRWFEKCKSAENIDDLGFEKVNKMLEVCDIYISFHTDKELSKVFEDNKHYEYAYKHYKALNDCKKMALMCIIQHNYEEFINIVKKFKINIFDLYGGKYDKDLDDFLDIKVNKVDELVNAVSYYVDEANKIMSNICIIE